MAASNPALAISYIGAHPDAAARVLESHNPASCAGLLCDQDIGLAGSLLQRMLPHYTSRVAAELDNARLAELFTAVDISYIAAVLRYLPLKQRNSLLGYLSPARRAACQLLLTFPRDSVGSWMSPEVVTLPEDSNVKAAREYIKSSEQLVLSDKLFVVNRDRQVIGSINNIDLTRSSKDEPITNLLSTDTEGLLARMSIQNAAQHHAWTQTDVMPVVNRSQQFIGIIRHVDLRMGLDKISSNPDPVPGENPLAGIFEAYGTTLLTLAGALEDIVVGADGDSRK
ncbi:MAG: CBS domain-containing protein [Gammaproteobacteria bacterium]